MPQGSGAGHAAHAWHGPCSRSGLSTAALEARGREIRGGKSSRDHLLSLRSGLEQQPPTLSPSRRCRLGPRGEAVPSCNASSGDGEGAGRDRQLQKPKTKNKKVVKKERKVGERERGGKGVERSGELGWTESHRRGRGHCPDAAAPPLRADADLLSFSYRILN